MNSLQRVQNILDGKAVDRVPNFDIFMARAAHHIGVPLSRFYSDHQALCEANLAVMETFDLDIVQTISDPYREAADIGLQVEFPEDDLPVSRKPLLVELDDLDRLRFPVKDFGPRMTDRLEGIRFLRSRVGSDVPVMGWVEGALAEAADLRGMDALMTDFLQHPDWLDGLLEKCVETAIAFACAQVEAGAHIVGLGDAVASQISPRMYRKFALPYEQRIFSAVRARGGISRLHICGNTTHLLPDMARSGAQIVDIDWMVDMRKAVAALDGLAVCGNLDPVAVFLRGAAESVRQGVFANAAVGYPRWISAGGCEIPDGTPAENLHAQRRALRELGCKT